jgi:outer membrane protein assembly factor BamD
MVAANEGSRILPTGSHGGKAARIERADDLLSWVMWMDSRPFSPAALSRARRLPLAAGMALLLLAGCGGGRLEDDRLPDQPPEQLYSEGQRLLDAGDYQGAAKAFEEVERQHPYSQWATRGELMAAYAYYEANRYDEAIGAAQRFIELHPGNKDVPYAHYLMGLCYYEQISDVGRDQEMTRKSLDTFTELVRRYPESNYAADAKLKIDLVRDHLAGKEMEVGRYYQRRQLWLASINRFQNVVQNYQTTTHVPEALHRLTESYLALGMKQQAQEAAAVLGHNFPGSEWYQRAYALLEGQNLEPAQGEGGSWLSRLF